MRVVYKQSIKKLIDRFIFDAELNGTEIDYIKLSEQEYIQFLEEIGDVGRIILIDPFTKIRAYKGTRLKVLS